jgi:glycosyltransferase involved in cell wall biosynthesis
MSAPSASVLLTSYNHAPYVEEALESLRAQTRQDFEVIVTDDASTDGTADVIAAWIDRHGAPYRFVRNRSNRGICANRNAALALARGPFVCSLSGDDAYEPDRIEHQLASFAAEPDDVAAVFGDMMMVRADGTSTGVTYLQSKFRDAPPPEGRAVFPALLRNNWMPSPAVMVRRRAFDAVGPYDETLVNEDYDMWLRLSHRFRFSHLARVIVRYRLLPDSLSHSPAREDAIVQSRGRVLSKWVGRCGPEDNAIVVDRLWGIGRDQLRRCHDAEGSRNLSLAAFADKRLKRRVVATAARFRIGRATLRAARVL